MFTPPDPASSTPPFEQLRTQVARLVDAGTLAPGSRLPTVRGLASELGLAANTVAKVYRELEADGVVETRGRAGTYVAGPTRATPALSAAAEAFVRTARRAGLTRAEAVVAVERAWDAAGG